MGSPLSWTWSLCGEVEGRRDPGPWTWVLYNTKQQPSLNTDKLSYDIVITENVCQRLQGHCALTLTSAHGARWGRPLGWRTTVADWGPSL